MRTLRLVIGLATLATTARAQLATPQPTEKLLVLTVNPKTGADSAMSVAVMDVAREKLGSMARYKVTVVQKAKLCEALAASDYTCNVLLDETQANQLARFLNVSAYTTGTLDRSGNGFNVSIRVHDIGGSGLASLFTVPSGNPGTAASVGEALAQRMNTLIRAAEHARECVDQRTKSQFGRALDAARKALAIEPNLPAAHICIATVYEAQHLGVDSQLVAYQRATRGDSLNGTAWDNIAHLYQQKGDTLKGIDALTHQLAGEPQNIQLRLGIVELLRQQKQYERGRTLLDDWLAKNPGDQRVVEFRMRVCIEGELWRCELDAFVEQIKSDSAKARDSTVLISALGAAQQLSDTQQLMFLTHTAVSRFPRKAAFWKALGSAFDLKGQKDSSVWAYKRALAIDSSDVSGALLIAKTLVEGATYDTARASKVKGDTAALHRLRNDFADQLDSAKAYLERAGASRDTSVQVNAAAIMRTAGERLVRAGASDRALAWLRRALALTAPRAASDTLGVRHAIRVNTSFWFGLASIPGLPAEYQAMTKSKNCGEAKAFNEQLGEIRTALMTGRSVHAPTVDNMLQTIGKFDTAMGSVKKAFKCKNF